MSLLSRRNSSSFPSLANDFFENDFFFRPSLIDYAGGMLGTLPNTLPNVNISEDEDSFKLELAAPGMEKKDFKIETEGGYLIISSEKQKESEEEKENYRRKEFSYSSFSRSFQLPENSLPEKIEAKYENGILRLVLPKKERTSLKHRKEIKVA
jgi:HSP20 family protein